MGEGNGKSGRKRNCCSWAVTYERQLKEKYNFKKPWTPVLEMYKLLYFVTHVLHKTVRQIDDSFPQTPNSKILYRFNMIHIL